MNFGSYMHVASMVYQVAEKFCGGEYEIRIKKLRSGALLFCLDWCPFDGDYMKHCAAAVDDSMSFADSMLVAERFKRDIEEHYSEEVLPLP